MGREAAARKARICRDCKQSIHAGSAGIKEHAGLCGRLAKLGLVVPGLLTGEAAYDALRQHTDRRKRRM